MNYSSGTVTNIPPKESLARNKQAASNEQRTSQPVDEMVSTFFSLYIQYYYFTKQYLKRLKRGPGHKKFQINVYIYI